MSGRKSKNHQQHRQDIQWPNIVNISLEIKMNKELTLSLATNVENLQIADWTISLFALG